jgi:3-oxoacyl-[acyl-carrier-protein] synthase-3
MVDTSDEWIVQRTGIRARHISDRDIFASHLAIEAVQDLARQPNIDISGVDLIIVTTMTPDYLTPSTAGRVQGALGLINAAVLDLNAACAGFVYGLSVANALITVGQYEKVLVVASEVMSKIVDYQDRNTCVLFGDGAAAALLEKTVEEGSFVASHSGSSGDLGRNLFCPGLSREIDAVFRMDKQVIIQDGKAIYGWALQTIPKNFEILLKKARICVDDIDWFVPHSANLRMIKSIAKRLGIPMSKVLTSIEGFGNTASVSIPLSLWLGLKGGKLKRGQTLVLYGFGGGLTHSGVVIRW